MSPANPRTTVTPKACQLLGKGTGFSKTLRTIQHCRPPKREEKLGTQNASLLLVAFPLLAPDPYHRS